MIWKHSAKSASVTKTPTSASADPDSQVVREGNSDFRNPMLCHFARACKKLLAWRTRKSKIRFQF